MRNNNQYYVYIITNKYNKVFYIGVTNDLVRRIFEHKNKLAEGFSKKYNLTKLVYYETTTDVKSAISKEKQLKNWHRDWKINLINNVNPQWQDLGEDIGVCKLKQEIPKQTFHEKMLKQVQHDTLENCHPEFISGSKKMPKHVRGSGHTG